MTGRRGAQLGLAGGLAAIGVAVTLLVWPGPAPAGQTVTTVGAAAAQALATESLATDAPATSQPSATADRSVGSVGGPTSPTAAGKKASGPTRPSAPATSAGRPSTSSRVAPAPPPVGPPIAVTLPSQHASGSVVPIGVDDDEALAIPKDVRTAGWYRFGPAPGQPGSAVLAGHVDDHLQGVGLFAVIGDLGVGDQIVVTDAGHVQRTFRVVAREEWHKSQVPMDRLFARSGPPRLVLLTCGGDFDRDTLSYVDNIAVTAELTG